MVVGDDKRSNICRRICPVWDPDGSGVVSASFICLFGLLFLVLGFLKYRRKHIELERLQPREAPCSDYLPRADSLTESDYQALVLREEEANRARKEEWDSARNDMNDYYAVWVHQIKAPIAVMRVMLQQEDTQENRELSAELFRIEQYAEMALYYIRLGEGASDLVIQEYELDDIIRKAVRKYAGQFIRRKIRLVYNGTDVCVVTDEKWLSFIIEQLLSNAVKYTPEGGTVTISVDDKKQLSITDTGIGISPEDLPRIFEKGYTGYNGRLDKKSTGIGLYLCRTAADKLGTGCWPGRSRERAAGLSSIWRRIHCRRSEWRRPLTRAACGFAKLYPRY